MFSPPVYFLTLRYIVNAYATSLFHRAVSEKKCHVILFRDAPEYSLLPNK
jgi:hypothetical protein